MSNNQITQKQATIRTWMGAESSQRVLLDTLAGYLDAKTFAAQCAIAVADENLAACSVESLFGAFLVCAQMGLLPGKHHRHVALIPRAGRVDVMPQWQGFKFLMERQPGIKRVEAHLVHLLDDFAWDGSTLVHRFDPFDIDRQFLHPSDVPKDVQLGLRGGYLEVLHDDGERRFHFVSLDKIERARSCSDIPDLNSKGRPGVWRLWYAEQATKTVYRDAFARRFVAIDATLEGRLAATLDADDKALGNDPSTTSHARALQHEVERPAAGMAGLKARMGNDSRSSKPSTTQTTQTSAEQPADLAAFHDEDLPQ